MRMNRNHSTKEEDFFRRKEMHKSIIVHIRDYILILGASFLYAYAVSRYLEPNQIVPGGITGLSIIVGNLTQIDTGTLIFLLNLPILIFGIVRFGFRFLISTVWAIIMISVFTNLMGQHRAVTRDLLLASIAGGGMIAVSLGIIFRCGATTGGTDIIVKWLKIKFPYKKTGMLFLLLDAIIILLSVVVFKDMESALYAGITVFVTSKVLDFFLYGADEAKLVYVITDRDECIVKRVLAECATGATVLSGYGAYGKKEKHIIMCAIKKTMMPIIEEIVKDEDPAAFMIITRASEIYGLGYKSYFSQKL